MSYIYTGAWINWSQGYYYGATLTVTDRGGGFLTSLIAIFITVVSLQLWRIFCYTVHQIRSTPTPQDGLHHQQQVIFRNSATPGSSAWYFTKQAWHWRGRAQNALSRTVPWLVLSMAYLLVFGLAAVLSSDISKYPGSARLVMSEFCGDWAIANTSDLSSEPAFSLKTTNDSITAATYARACYGGSYNPLVCDRFPKNEILRRNNANETCPFGDDICVYGSTAAYNMTTEVIDSHDHLGINAPPENRVWFQRTTTCAPLKIANWSYTTNSTFAQTRGDKLMNFYYGPIMNSINNSAITNSTFEYNIHTWVLNIGYTVNSAYAEAGLFGSYVPIPALNRTDADISIVLIAPNSIQFQKPSNDPIFLSGTNEEMHYQATLGSGYDWEYWYSDNYAAPIACTEQYRICNPNSDLCSPYMGHYQLISFLLEYNNNTIKLNDVQQVTAARLLRAAQFTALYHQVTNRGSAAIRASETASGLWQAPLPNNQWMVEIGSWFDAAQARFQQAILEFATGPTNVKDGTYLQRPDNPMQQAMCSSQMINDTQGTMSFSILGMSVLFLTGAVVIGTNSCIENLVGYFQRKFHWGYSKRRSWLLDDKLQLQRLLFDEKAMGRWNKGRDANVPTTIDHGKFIGLGAKGDEIPDGYAIVSGGNWSNAGDESPFDPLSPYSPATPFSPFGQHLAYAQNGTNMDYATKAVLSATFAGPSPPPPGPPHLYPQQPPTQPRPCSMQPSMQPPVQSQHTPLQTYPPMRPPFYDPRSRNDFDQTS